MIPSLPERFLAPTGWQADSFINEETGHKIHYGFVSPKNSNPPSAVVVCLSGLSEFSEKYYELAHDMLDRGYAFWIMDWQYQGRSSRLERHPHRRHSDGFDKDVSDFFKFVREHVKPASRDIPLVMLGHSMGAHIGLRFLADYPAYFQAAAFSAPFFGIYNFTKPLKLVSKLVVPFIPLIGTSYAFGSSDWQMSSRKSDGTDKFSSDPFRDSLHNLWSKSEPALQIGGPTFRWVVEALKSCAYLNANKNVESISIPIVMALAGKEQIVDNKAIRLMARRLLKSQTVDIKGAKHEIFMEQDEFRTLFLKAFDKMVEEHNIGFHRDVETH